MIEKLNYFAGLCGNWIEIAYGTRQGLVRVIVQHPETGEEYFLKPEKGIVS